MTWAVCPSQGLPRLFRYDLDEPGVVARLNKDDNLLRINRELFDQLSPMQQWIVMKTASTIVVLEEMQGTPAESPILQPVFE